MTTERPLNFFGLRNVGVVTVMNASKFVIWYPLAHLGYLDPYGIDDYRLVFCPHSTGFH